MCPTSMGELNFSNLIDVNLVCVYLRVCEINLYGLFDVSLDVCAHVDMLGTFR